MNIILEANMEISYIKEFVTLAQERQYVSASKKLFISQSTLSRHVQALEKEIGYKLFDRTTRDVELSAEGKTFLPFARNIVDNDEAFFKELNERNISDDQPTIGIVHDPDKWNITQYIDEFLNAYPDIKLNIQECSLSELHDKLANDELHVVTMAFSYWQTLPKNFIVCGTSHLVAVMHKDHPLSKKKTLSVDDIKNEPLFMPMEKYYTYQYFHHAIEARGIHPNIVYKGNSHGINDLLKNNRGVLIQDERVVSEKLSDDFVAISFDPDIFYYYGLEYSQNLSSVEKTFLKYIRQRHMAVTV